MTQLTACELTAIIERVTDDWIFSGRVTELQKINNGPCADFAYAVTEEVKRLGYVEGPEIYELGSFLVNKDHPLAEHSYEGDLDPVRPIDVELLTTHWPGVVPTHGCGWDEIEGCSFWSSWSDGSHTWLFFNGLHYDAEAPEGVVNFLTLPIFDRCIRAMVEYVPSDERQL